MEPNAEQKNLIKLSSLFSMRRQHLSLTALEASVRYRLLEKEYRFRDLSPFTYRDTRRR